MKEIDFLYAVGRVDRKYIDECITYTPPKRMNVWIRRMSTIAACFLVIIGAVLFINHLNQPVIIDENGFYIEDGVLLRYTGSETDVTIPEEVKTIADFTFLENTNRTKIEVVRLGASVQKVETNAFAGLENLVDIIIAANNLSFVEEDGLLMTSDKSILLQYKRQGETSFTIPESVRFVAAHAVQGTELEEIDFGNIEYIGYNAFASNYKLKAIYLPDSVKYISEGAFASCSSAVDGTVPEDAEIVEGAFWSVPFYNSMLAGQMCPGEEIVRGLITPSEAILKTDMDSLTEQITYVLAALRGDSDYEPSEAAMFGHAAAHDPPDVPEDLTVPESFTINDLTFADSGWGNTGIYDLQIILPAGDYSIVMEAYGYGLWEELYWHESRFRLSNVYYVKNAVETDPTAVEGAFGWTATFGRNGEYYKDITLTNEDGRMIHQSIGYDCLDLPKLIFSPEGTRVAVEYHHVYGYYSFYVISLNGDNLMEPHYKYSEYLSKYYGDYTAGSLRFIDEDNIEGENEFGRFRWNIYDFKVSYPDEDPALSDPNNTNKQTITLDVPGYSVRMEIPEIWRYNGHTYHDRVREADETLDPMRLNPSIDMHTNLLMDTDGNWTPERLDGSMITRENFGYTLATVVTTGTNANGLSYLILKDESLDPYTIGKDYSIAFAHNAQILFSFCISTYPEDGEHDFEEIVLPIIESVTAEEELPSCLSTVVDTLPQDAEKARITARLMGGSPVLYVFNDTMRFYAAYLNADMNIATLYECTLSIPGGYIDGRIIDAGGRGGSGEFCIWVSARRGTKTEILAYLFDGQGIPEPHEVLTETDEHILNYQIEKERFFDWINATGEAAAFPPFAYTISVTGFDKTSVTLDMDAYSHPVSITAYDQTVPITDDRITLYGNCAVNLFEADGAIIFSWDYYGIGYTYILGEGFTEVIELGTDHTVKLYVDENGDLRYQRTNNQIADIVQTGGLSAATGYDDLLYCYGDASIDNGKLILSDADEYYSIGDKYDLDLEFENMYSRYYDSIQDVFEQNKLYPGGAIYRPTVFEVLLTMSVADIRSTYGTLTLEYSEHGPGQPVYSMKYLPGVLLVFHNWNMDDPLSDNMIPAELILTENCSRDVRGITVGANIEDRTQTIHWSDLWYHVINGTANLQAEFSGYTATYTISGENLNLPAEDTAHEFDWDTWEAEYIQNPTGRVVEIRIKLNQ